MAHGGARSNAGRKPGQATKANQEAREAAADGGMMPLDYMLNIMRDAWATTERRDDMAKAAAPYVHARLSNINAKHDVSDTLGDLLKAVDGRTRGIPSSG